MVRILKQEDWYLNLIVFILVLSLYLWSMPGTVVLEDDGLFILAGWFNGVAHPPGYPLYTLLAYLATHLPVAMTVAWKSHALSALLGALACCFVSMATRELLDSRLAAVTAGVGYGVSEVFWSQAIIAEVYTLNSLLFFLAVWLCLRFQQQGKYPLPVLYTVAFICGLGLSNHWPLFILSSPLLLGILWPWRWATLRTVNIKTRESAEKIQPPQSYIPVCKYIIQNKITGHRQIGADYLCNHKINVKQTVHRP